VTAAALAPATTPTWPAAGTESGLYGLGVATLVVMLVAVLAWLFRRGTLRLGPRQPRTSLKVESGVSLGDRRALAIVTVDGRRLLLGLAPGQVSLLVELAAVPPAFDAALGRSLDGKREGGA
jgi:flagellar protein FliO/FliZ